MHVPKSPVFNRATEGVGHFVFAWDLLQSGSAATSLILQSKGLILAGALF